MPMVRPSIELFDNVINLHQSEANKMCQIVTEIGNNL